MNTRNMPSWISVERNRRRRLGTVLGRTLERVNVLGDDRRYGHTGCVNALSWAQDGASLLSGGDDTTVRLWKMDTSDTATEYPFVGRCVIRTGHTANIFSAQMLPQSSRIATAAGDAQVRVFDVRSALFSSSAADEEIDLSRSQSCIAVIRCHSDRVKRIVTEDSSDLFLSVAEDGTVRQHDLRSPHSCETNSCAAPLIEVGHELSTLSLSPVTPYQLLVAGGGPYGYLFDRRHSRRVLEAQWGAVPQHGKELTTCIRRFGRPQASSERFGRPHITGARLSKSNGHELILSYSGDGVYLYSTTDDPILRDDMSRKDLPPMPSKGVNTRYAESDVRIALGNEVGEEGTSPPPDDIFLELAPTPDSDEHDPESSGPIVMPRRHFTGNRNIATIKDVNFLGPNDEWVTSGSDDGNFFIWNKLTGALHGIYEGDSSVVNMVEGHPSLPLIATSGIDTTVKLFAPSSSLSVFSKLAEAEQIIQTNKRLGTTRTLRYSDLASVLAEASGGGEMTIRVPQCVGQ